MQNQNQTQIKLEEAKTGFKANLTAYAIVNTMLITINVLAVPQFPFAIFPLCGWGLGLAMHYTFGLRPLKKAQSQQ